MLAVLRILILVPVGYILAIVAAAVIVGAAASDTYDRVAITLVVPYAFSISAIGAAAFAPYVTVTDVWGGMRPTFMPNPAIPCDSGLSPSMSAYHIAQQIKPHLRPGVPFYSVNGYDQT